MRRREVIALVGGAGAWPVAARAQSAKLPTVGLLVPGTPASFGQRVAVERRNCENWVGSKAAPSRSNIAGPKHDAPTSVPDPVTSDHR
jgi:hypothetical protein